jgi:hypothetical protein
VNDNNISPSYQLKHLWKQDPTNVDNCNSNTPLASNRGLITDSTVVINKVSFSPITCITLNYNNCVSTTTSPVAISQTNTTTSEEVDLIRMEDEYTEVDYLDSEVEFGEDEFTIVDVDDSNNVSNGIHCQFKSLRKES